MARYQSPNSSYRSLRWRAAARVDFSGSDRSSIHQVCRRPYSLPRERDELPHSARLGPGDSSREERAFGLGQKHQIEGNLFFLQDSFHHRTVEADSLQSDAHRISPASLMEVIQRCQNPAIEFNRKVVLHVADSRLHRLFLLGIDGSGESWDQVQVVNRRALGALIGEAIPVPDCRHLHFVNSRDQLTQFSADSVVPGESAGRIQENIDRGVKFGFGLLQESGVVELGTPVKVAPCVRENGSDLIRRDGCLPREFRRDFGGHDGLVQP